MITSTGMRALVLRGTDDRVVQVRLALADAGQRAADRVLAAGGDQQLLRREAGDHLAAVGGDDQLLLDACGRPAVRRRPERLEREHHPLLDRLRIVEGDEAREDRLLPARESD